MLKKIEFKINGINSENDRVLIETEIEILNGVKDVSMETHTGKCKIEFDDNKIPESGIFGKIQELGYAAENKKIKRIPTIKEQIYFIKGMRCASCEIIIEKKLLGLREVKSVEASTSKGQVVVEYEGEKAPLEKLNRLFRKENYIFLEKPFEKEDNFWKNFFIILVTSLFIIFGFFAIKNSSFAAFVNVNSKSSLPTFFALGIIAGISSCAALVGGLVLSMSKQWLASYSQSDSAAAKLQPHVMFNIGRIVSYSLLGAILGIVGNKLQISPTFTSVLIIAVSILMIALALQMLGISAFRNFQFSLPKSITREVANEKNFRGKYTPFLLGAATFFLPCGFTLTAQGMALISGSPLQGGLIMLAFALGTAPMLLLIGFSSVKFSEKPHLAYRFSKIAGILVLFFALYNINSQLNVLGIKSFSDLQSNPTKASASKQDDDLPPIVNGKQIIKMTASVYGYNPNYFKLRSGVPVVWEITDTGTSGCTNAIISRSLFNGEISLTPGQTAVKEFTPGKPGKYKFSCWMGMVSGVIEVVEAGSGASVKAANVLLGDSNAVIPSGAAGCGGCGGGSSGACGAARKPANL